MDYNQSIPPNFNVNENYDAIEPYTVNEDPNTFEGLFFTIFNKSNIIMLLWFLAIYFIAYFVLGFIFNKNEDVSNYQLRFSRTIDIIGLLCILIIIISTYASYSPEKKKSLVQNTFNSTSTFVNDPISIFSMGMFLVCFYIVVYLFRLPMDRETKPIIVSIIETSAWLLFVIIIFADFFKYVLGLSLTDGISKLLNWDSLPDNSPIPQPKPFVKSNSTTYSGNIISNVNTKTSGNISISQPVQKDEVFNISNNLYTYDDAQAICTSYGAKLANYDQIEDAYKNGAEWCNYGWSDGQMAYFPTQKSTWSTLQNTNKNKNDCGRPGINGGFFANPFIKFGVNCFGKKPNPNDNELARMNELNNKIYPKNPKDSIIDKKVEFWKENANKLLVLNSFNKKEWSEH
jgi:hypothetical protein